MNSVHGHNRIIIFARPPRPGQCKTRLIPAYGSIGAARIYRGLIRRTVQAAVESKSAAVELWISDTPSHPFLGRLASEFGLVQRQQRRGNLGQRMGQAMSDALRRGAGSVVLVGTDAVDLEPLDFHTAFEYLKSPDRAVLQPSLDGGYVLIGLNHTPAARLNRGIQWSSGLELDQTRRRLLEGGLQIHLMRPRLDIDLPADLRRAKRANLL
tara:strand:+ start:3875 stop:4507 length:633 start_codon:yes stop_codon:yes gene_type:complete